MDAAPAPPAVSWLLSAGGLGGGGSSNPSRSGGRTREAWRLWRDMATTYQYLPTALPVNIYVVCNVKITDEDDIIIESL